MRSIYKLYTTEDSKKNKHGQLDYLGQHFTTELGDYIEYFSPFTDDTYKDWKKVTLDNSYFFNQKDAELYCIINGIELYKD